MARHFKNKNTKMIKSFISSLLILTITGNTFSQTFNYEVYALRFASMNNGKPVPLSVAVLNAPKNETAKGDFIIWLIKGNNGRNILVDAGFLNDIEEAKNSGVSDYVRPDSMVLKLGLKPTAITDIILTHPHWDHVDGVDLFPNAQVWIQKEDFNDFVDTAWQKKGQAAGFNKRDVLKIVKLNLSGKVKMVDGDDKEIIPGINVYTGSRHTFNSQYVLVKSGMDKIIIASDNAYTYYNIDHSKSAPAHATFDTTAYVKAIERMKTLASDVKFIIPGHDNLMFAKFPTITEGIIKIK
jgi:glyoxylase-like metal-dependent hydrolase (beta-lactamase superfamily II)